MLKSGAENTHESFACVYELCVWYVNYTRFQSHKRRMFAVLQYLNCKNNTMVKMKILLAGYICEVLPPLASSRDEMRWDVALIYKGVGYHIFEWPSYFNGFFMIAIIRNFSSIESEWIKSKTWNTRLFALNQNRFAQQEIYGKPLHLSFCNIYWHTIHW